MMSKRLGMMLPAVALAAVVSIGAIGCAVERPSEVPANALMAGAGNEVVTYTAPRDGMIYVVDTQEDRMVYRGQIERGQVITVDPKMDKVTLEGRTVFEKGLHKGHQHKIFFDEDAPSARY